MKLTTPVLLIALLICLAIPGLSWQMSCGECVWGGNKAAAEAIRNCDSAREDCNKKAGAAKCAWWVAHWAECAPNCEVPITIVDDCNALD